MTGVRLWLAISGLILVGLSGFIALAIDRPERADDELRDVLLEQSRRKLERVCAQARGQVVLAQSWVEHDPVRTEIGTTITLAFTGVIEECKDVP